MNKMYTINSFWDYFAESIFNAKMIKSLAPNSTQCTHFQTFPAYWFEDLRRIASVQVSAPLEEKLLSVRGPCLSWQKSNMNNCIDYMTTLLSLEMSLCLLFKRWNYRNRRETVSDLWWKICNKATLKVHCLVIRYKRLLSGYCINFSELWTVSRAKCRCNISVIMVLHFYRDTPALGRLVAVTVLVTSLRDLILNIKKPIPKQNMRNIFNEGFVSTF